MTDRGVRKINSTSTLSVYNGPSPRPMLLADLGRKAFAYLSALGVAVLIAFHTRWAARVSEPPFDCGSVSKAPRWLVQTLTESGKRTFEARRGSR